MPLAALYARQSKENDEGIDRQVRRTRALAEARDWQIAAEYSDNDVSASKPRGPKSGWAAMLAAAEAGAFTHVVAVDLDRLVRSQADLIRLMELKLAVVTVDGEIDLSTADGEFRASLGASLARFEVRRKGERTRRANEDRRLKGRLTPGRRLFGYETDGTTPRDAEAAIVRRVYEHVAEGRSVYGIARALRDEGVPFTTGSAESWRPARVRDMILNRRYSGQVFAPVGTAADLKGWQRVQQRRDPSAWIAGNVPALVDDTTAEQARAVLSDPTRRTTPGPARRHLLSGIAVCGECGAGLKQVHGDYRCSVASAHPTIRAALLETFVRAEVVYAMAAGGPGIVQGAADASGLTQAVAAWRDNEARQTEVQERERMGLLSKSVAVQELIALREERDALTVTLERLRTEQSAAGVLVGLATELLDGLPAAYAALGRQGADIRQQVAERFDALDLDQQREVVRAAVTVQVDRGRGTGRVRVQHLLAEQFNPSDAVAGN
ncbi:recombinase family protein [Curtobacterium sp. KT1]|uniref:recombinase family protein n=1 Tax=Curtobacterium sp. KT1 TaxID=3372858 RepID=UPI0037BF73F2